jgi:tripartite-type tricarboxylate transporter receptor subunit TctC
MTRNLVLALGLACGLGTLATGQHAAAQSAEEAYFKGKAIKMIVGYGPGGGYDAYARMLAPSLSKAIGGTVVVENQPGAGGLTALDRIYAAPPDGLQIMIVNGTAASMAQLLGETAVRYDLAKIGYLGIVSASPWVWLVDPKSKIQTPADAMKPGVKLRWSATGPIDGLSDGAAFTCEALHLSCQIIMGYAGTNEAAHAVGSGEMDALYVSDTSANNYVKSAEARAVASMGRVKSRFFPDKPTIFEAVKLTPDQQWWFDFRANVDNLGRIMVVPPNMPPARLAFLQSAVKKVLSDPQVIAEGEKTQRYIDYQDPETTKKMAVAVVGSLSDDQRKKVKAVVEQKQ